MAVPDRPVRPLGLALIAVGGAAGVAAFAIGGGDGAWGPRIVPLLAAVTIAAAGLALVRPAPPTGAGEGAGDPTAPVILLLGVAILYVIAIDCVGYLVATALAAPAAFALFGMRRPLLLLSAAIAVPLVLHAVFFRLLGVFPPLGRWFDLLDHLPL